MVNVLFFDGHVQTLPRITLPWYVGDNTDLFPRFDMGEVGSAYLLDYQGFAGRQAGSVGPIGAWISKSVLRRCAQTGRFVLIRLEGGHVGRVNVADRRIDQAQSKSKCVFSEAEDERSSRQRSGISDSI